MPAQLHDLSKGVLKARQASHNLSPASSGAYQNRDFSWSDIDQSSQLLPRTPSKQTSMAYSMMNDEDPRYSATPYWSFTVPVGSHAEMVASSRPSSTLQETSRLGGRESDNFGTTPTRPPMSSHSTRLLPRSISTERMDDDDFVDDDDSALWMAQHAEDGMRRSSLASSKSRAPRFSAVIPRNLPTTAPFITLDAFTYKDIPLAESVYVELEDRDFLRIVHIIQDVSTSAVTLRGWKFRRTRELNGVIDKKLNEVCWILHIDDDDPRDAKVQGMETVSVCEVLKRRRIRLTNQSFPALSWRDDGQKEKPETIEKDRVLVCRYKYLCFYANAKARAAYDWYEKGFHRLRGDECDQRSDNNMKDEELRYIWRGHTVPGGAQIGWLPGEKEYLRQEEVSHRGIASRSSLKGPSSLDFPIGDPMKRGNVGFLVTEVDLQPSFGTSTQSRSLDDNNLVRTNATTESSDKSKLSSILLTSRSQEQPQVRRDSQESQFIFSNFNRLPLETGDSDTGRDHNISEFRRGLRRNSIQAQKAKNISPRIIEIDAQVKNSSSLGTFEKRYEGRNTSQYYPTARTAQRKRSADMSPGAPARPTKRVNHGLEASLSKGSRQNRYNDYGDRPLTDRSRQCYEESTSSDSDRTLGRSPSTDSLEEIYTPWKYRGCRRSIPGLRSLVSQRKGSVLQRSGDPMPNPRLDDFPEYSQPLMPLTKISPSPMVSNTQAQGKTQDDDVIIDLTRRRANPYGSFSSAHSSKCQRSSPSTSSHEDKILPLHPERPLFLREKSRQQSKTTDKEFRISKAHKRRYTFGDCFCGAGGMSRGAVSAGLRVKWGFDFDSAACQSYQKNFFGTTIYKVWANQFSEAIGDHKVDICHLSPPCQFFSDAHTIQGKDDDMNTASLFAIFNLLVKAKPRIVTIEQTSGLIRRHPIFFNAVINMFTSRGFSVRWKVMNCADFGLPQRRTRLFIMASW